MKIFYLKIFLSFYSIVNGLSCYSQITNITQAKEKIIQIYRDEYCLDVPNPTIIFLESCKQWTSTLYLDHDLFRIYLFDDDSYSAIKCNDPIFRPQGEYRILTVIWDNGTTNIVQNLNLWESAQDTVNYKFTIFSKKIGLSESILKYNFIANIIVPSENISFHEEDYLNWVNYVGKIGYPITDYDVLVIFRPDARNPDGGYASPVYKYIQMGWFGSATDHGDFTSYFMNMFARAIYMHEMFHLFGWEHEWGLGFYDIASNFENYELFGYSDTDGDDIIEILDNNPYGINNVSDGCYLTCYPNELYFNSLGGNTTISVKTSTSWNVSCPNWITISPMSGTGNSNITVMLGENVDTTLRISSFKIYDSNNEVFIPIYQRERVPNKPIVINAIGDKEVNIGQNLVASVSSEIGQIFDDPDSGDILTISVEQEGGIPLPSFITYYNNELIIKPSQSDTGCYKIVVKAEDLYKNFATDTFKLCVVRSNTNDIRIYPNPTSGLFNIQMDNNFLDCFVSVHNYLGTEVFKRTFNALEPLIVDLSQSPSGFYILTLMCGDVEIKEKIILDKLR